jgi:hypothetical protein
MSSTKPTFKTIDFNVIAAADKFAMDNGVGKLVFPKQVDESGEGSAPAPISEPAAKTAAPQRALKPEPALLSPVKRMAVELPEYLVKAVSDKAHVSETTIRYVVTHALQKAGFFVAAADLKEDGRRGN